jgi:two-component system sensor histidine kinase EvgS
LSRAQVLIVDDDRPTRLVCASYCDLFDHASETVASVGEAIAALRRGVFDVVVAGVHMASCGGLSLVRTVRALPHPVGAIPIIGLTGLGREEEAQRWMAAGCFAVAPKPVTASRLYAALAAATALPILERRSWAPAG